MTSAWIWGCCFCFSLVQSFSRFWLFATPGTAACQASLSITNSWSLLKLMSIETMMPSNHLIICHPLLFLPSIFPSIRVFFSESVPHIRWWKHWGFSFSISPSSEYSGLIAFRIDWFDLLEAQGILQSLFQHHSSVFISYWFSLSLRSRLHLSLFHWPRLLQYSLPLLVAPLLYPFLRHWTCSPIGSSWLVTTWLCAFPNWSLLSSLVLPSYWPFIQSCAPSLVVS